MTTGNRLTADLCHCIYCFVCGFEYLVSSQWKSFFLLTPARSDPIQKRSKFSSKEKLHTAPYRQQRQDCLFFEHGDFILGTFPRQFGKVDAYWKGSDLFMPCRLCSSYHGSRATDRNGKMCQKCNSTQKLQTVYLWWGCVVVCQ